MWQIEKGMILWGRQGRFEMFLKCEAACWGAVLCLFFFPPKVSLGSKSSSWPVSISQPAGLWNDPPQGSPGAPQTFSAVPFTLLLPSYVVSRSPSQLLCCFISTLLHLKPSHIALFCTAWHVKFLLDEIFKALIGSEFMKEEKQKCPTNKDNLFQQPSVLLSFGLSFEVKTQSSSGWFDIFLL